jgi:PAS domain S-box-containing protein
LGWEPNEMLYQKFVQFIVPEERDEFIHKIYFFKENYNSFWSMQCNFQRKTGGNILLEINGVLIYDKDREICGYEGIIYEV